MDKKSKEFYDELYQLPCYSIDDLQLWSCTHAIDLANHIEKLNTDIENTKRITNKEFDYICKAVYDHWWKICKLNLPKIPYSEIDQDVIYYTQETVKCVLNMLHIKYKKSNK